jgi:hypothetical protein
VGVGAGCWLTHPLSMTIRDKDNPQKYENPFFVHNYSPFCKKMHEKYQHHMKNVSYSFNL